VFKNVSLFCSWKRSTTSFNPFHVKFLQKMRKVNSGLAASLSECGSDGSLNVFAVSFPRVSHELTAIFSPTARRLLGFGVAADCRLTRATALTSACGFAVQSKRKLCSVNASANIIVSLLPSGQRCRERLTPVEDLKKRSVVLIKTSEGDNGLKWA